MVSTPEPAPGTEPCATGIVWLVGAGPGDPDLITVAGLNALRRADVVVYDRLAPAALLREARDGALLIDAGKAPGTHTLGQEAINQTLTEHARAGRTIVRLKGGDPFVFGRGGEEALYLRERGIPFRVVPGVTSAVAAPAFAGIPVTHRGVAGSVLFATGHEAGGPDSNDGDARTEDRTTDWGALAHGADTLVFLMGVERLAAITTRLIEAGRPADQPAALVHRGSTPAQTVIEATLGTIVDEARARALRPPAALVVGEVVRLRERLGWFETLPLFGARVLVTRTRARASDLAARLRALGAAPLEFPAIEVRPLADTRTLDDALRRLDGCEWAVFASAQGVDAAFDRLDAVGLDARAFAGVRLCAVGPATARALAERGLRADIVPETYSSDGIVRALNSTGAGIGRVLLLQAEIAPPALAEGLRAAGAEVQRVATYRTVAGPERRPALDALLVGGLDVATFTSSSTVTNLLATLDGDAAPLAGALIASIGPSTSATARAAGLMVDVEANPHTVEGLVQAVVRAWQGGRAGKEMGK